MELNKQNLKLVKKLLEDKIVFYSQIIIDLKIDIDLNTSTDRCKFKLSESMQVKHDNNKKALKEAVANRLECYELLEQVQKELKLKKNCEGTFIAGFHD